MSKSVFVILFLTNKKIDTTIMSKQYIIKLPLADS